MNGPGIQHHLASSIPSASNNYLWIVFSSERDYGHRITGEFRSRVPWQWRTVQADLIAPPTRPSRWHRGSQRRAGWMPGQTWTKTTSARTDVAHAASRADPTTGRDPVFETRMRLATHACSARLYRMQLRNQRFRHLRLARSCWSRRMRWHTADMTVGILTSTPDEPPSVVGWPTDG
jgi:hypothetical protein